jgi:uracil-DNA glycosylase
MTTAETYLNRLNDYYSKDKQIGVTENDDDFRCAHVKDCRYKDYQIFRGADTFVGTWYGKSPKLLFVSLDRGEGKSNFDSRRYEIENRVPRNRHMIGILETAKRILDYEYAPSNKQSLLLNYTEVFSRCAMINSAKCCVKDEKHSMAMAPKRFYTKCRPYVKDEVDILEPDIIVTQGILAWLTIEKYKTGIENINDTIENKCSPHNINEIKDAAEKYLYRLVDSNTLVLRSVHPSAWGKGENRWDYYTKSILPVMADLVRELLCIKITSC